MARHALVGFIPLLFPVLNPVHGETDLAELAKAPPGARHSYGADPLQFGELSMPEGPGPHPVVINIHGGCWLAEYDIKHSRAQTQALCRAGYAAWNLEYRRVGDPGGGWPGTFQDVGSGADHLRSLAKDHALDLSRVVAMGHSAGGQLALWLAARPKVPAGSELHTTNPIAIHGVVALAPAAELGALHEKGVCNGVVDKLMGGAPAAVPERYRIAVPAELAPIGVAQVLIIGENDKAWSWAGKSYFDKARAAGDERIQLISVPDAGHFEVIDPASTAWLYVIKATRELLEMHPPSP